VLRSAYVVGAVPFLAGPMSDFVTGRTVVVDGRVHFH
jgi:NAD(P)-dependent dehydrogenase (short-subunit alcohol dehydrogenase family)